MTRTKAVVAVLVVGTAAAAAAYAVSEFRKRKAVADAAIGNIQAELDGLDPVTRAAVVAKLSKDEIRARRSSHQPPGA